METQSRVLGALRDLRGVEGSFYASREGEVLARDMPRIYDGDDLADVATRMSRFLDAVVDLGGTNEGVMIRHPHHTIFLRGTDEGFLGVLATSEINVPALKRGASLVLRRLPGAAKEGAPSTPPIVPSASGAALLPPPLPAEARKPAMPPPLPESARDSQPSAPPAVAAAPAPRPRISVPGAPAPQRSSSGGPAIRWRGSVKDS